MSESIEIFFCYARKDQHLLDKLKVHLMPLQRTGLIRMWYDADISPGTNWEEEIHKHLNTADLILLLVSPDFITSEYCYSIEMIQAMERHERQEAQVIPIILRPIYWQKTPFGMLQALPTDAIPVVSRTWYDLDEALYDVAEGIRKAVEELILAKRFASISQRAKQALASLVEEKGNTVSVSPRKLASRPLHLILIIDCSISTKGAKIQALNTIIREAIAPIQAAAKRHPRTQVLVRAITSSADNHWCINHPIPIENFKWTDVAPYRKRDLSETLFEVTEELNSSILGKDAAPPVLIFLSDGSPSDNFEAGLQALMTQPWSNDAVRLAVGIGSDVKYEPLQKFIGNTTVSPVQADRLEDLVDYIKWEDDDEKDTSNTRSSPMLRRGQKVQTVSGLGCEIQELIGVGGQGEVYRVMAAERPMALKWYYPRSGATEQWQALEALVKKGPPNDKFLWPLELLASPGRANFGYLMPLRSDKYKSLVDLMKRRVNINFRTLATIGFYLVDSYIRLHIEGLCYRDISFGNVFFDPKSGEVLICDNDNIVVDGDISGGILGTSRFMAPEIMRGEALPSTRTDLYSLSILLFYLLMFHHPLEGKREADIQVLDLEAMTRLYGTEPIFIFDPDDDSNRPVRGYQDNALIFWPLYPQFLRDLFIRAFTNGLKDPIHGRVRESEWRTAMIHLRDSIYHCSHCQAENFYDHEMVKINPNKLKACWSCKKEGTYPFRLNINESIIMLDYDTQLFPHHIGGSRYDFSHPVAEVVSVTSNPTIWALKNLSDEIWHVSGSNKKVGKGESITLNVGMKINFGNREGSIEGSAEGIRKAAEEQPVKSTSFSSRPGGELIPWSSCHFIWILDCSDSMKGDKIQSLNTAIRECIPELRMAAQSNPHARLLVRAIAFSSEAKWHIAQPTNIDQFQWVDLVGGGKREMGKALQLVADELKIPPMPIRSLPPVLVLVTDGYPTDDAMQGIRAILDQPWGRRAVRIGIGIGDKAPYELLQKFIGNLEIKPLHARNADQIVSYIKWADEMIDDEAIDEKLNASEYIKGNIPNPPSEPLSPDVW